MQKQFEEEIFDGGFEVVGTGGNHTQNVEMGNLL